MVTETAAANAYRLLETMRQYALEKLGESGEADEVRTDIGTTTPRWLCRLDDHAQSRKKALLEQAEREMDNLRAAFGRSLDTFDDESALQIASALQPIWVTRGWIGEGMNWLDAALAAADAGGREVAPAVRARALPTRPGSMLRSARAAPTKPEEALAVAREIGDRALLARAWSQPVPSMASSRRWPARSSRKGSNWRVLSTTARLVGYVLGWQSVGASWPATPQ